YRGQQDRFLELVADHLSNAVAEGTSSVATAMALLEKLAVARGTTTAFFKASGEERAKTAFGGFKTVAEALEKDIQAFASQAKDVGLAWGKAKKTMAGLKLAADKIAPSADISHDLVRDIDHVAKLFSRAVDLAEKEWGAKDNGIWSSREVRA